jgi:hypothetical protein
VSFERFYRRLQLNFGHFLYPESAFTDCLSDSSAGLNSKNDVSGVSPFFSAEDINIDLSNNNNCKPAGETPDVRMIFLNVNR